MSRHFRFVIVLVGVIISSPGTAQNLIPWSDDWGSSLRSLSGEGLKSTDRLLETGSLPRQVRLEYIRRQPYNLNHDQGSLNWSETWRRLQLNWPIFRAKHSFLLAADFQEQAAGGSANSHRRRSKLSLKNDYAISEVDLAHHWQAMKLRWGVGLRWTHLGARTYFDPVWELGWGEDAAARFTIHLERQTQLNPWSWKLESDSLAGSWAAQEETAAFTVMFGNPFGIRMQLGFIDKYLKGVSVSSGRPWALTPLGQKQTLSAYVERSPTTGLRWKIGGAHTNQEAEATLSRAGNTAARASRWDSITDCWGGACGGNWRRRWSWLAAAHYYRLKNQIGGWIIPETLPEAFQMVIREDRFYFGEAAFTGADISGRLTARGSWFRGQLETGYIGVHITQNFVDFDPQAESARRTLIGLEGVGLGWVTLQGEVSWKLLNFNLSFSQMFPYWERYRKDYQPLANRRLKGGWLAKMGFEYRIA